MASHDIIGDMFAKIKNAITARHEYVDVIPSKEKVEIIKILKNEGYIKNFRRIVENDKQFTRIFLKYDETGKSVIDGIMRISKPGRRIYKGYKDMPRLYNGAGTVIVSTSAGITTGRKAIEKKIGGEILCTVW